VHGLGKRGLALALVCALAGAPAFGAPKPLGMVLSASRARLANDAVQAGTNVYVGDSASTEKNGGLLMRLGVAQVYLGGESYALLQESDSRVTTLLQKGTLGFSVQGEESLLVYASGVWVRAQTTAPTSGEVTIVNEHELLITSRGGPLEMIVNGETTVVPQNQSARVNPEPERRPVEGAGANAVNKGQLLKIVLLTAGAAALITCAVLFNTGNSVSPARASGACE
jgi:hypothetical protein